MSHFPVLVITDRQPSEDDLTAILQPWHEYECTGVKDQYVVWIDHTEEVQAEWRGDAKLDYWPKDWPAAPSDKYDSVEAFAEDFHGYEIEGDKIGRWTNPNRKWDWWVVGGRWSGLLRSTVNGIKGSPGLMGAQYDPNGIDICRRGDLDLEAMKVERVRQRELMFSEGLKRYRKQPEANASITIEMLKNDAAAYSMAVADARSAWESAGQPGRFADFIDTADTSAAAVLRRLRETYGHLFSWDVELPEGTADADEWIKAAPAVSAFAVVKDGQWFEKGEMGWWACVSNEKPEAEWQAQLDELVLTLPDDAWLTVVDCHI